MVPIENPWPSKFCISIVSSFSRDLTSQWSQDKTKTMLLQNMEGHTKSIMVFSKVAYKALPIIALLNDERSIENC